MVGSLFRATAWRVSVYAAAGFVALVLGAWVYARTLNDSPWTILVGWTLISLYAVVGTVGGAATGLITAVAHLITAFERECRDWLERLEGPRDDLPFDPLPLPELSSRIRELADRIVARTIGRLPLPKLITQLLASRLCKALLDDFLSECERRGITVIQFRDVRGWLLIRGLSLAIVPLLVRLHMARWIIIAVLALMGAAVVLLALAA